MSTENLFVTTKDQLITRIASIVDQYETSLLRGLHLPTILMADYYPSEIFSLFSENVK